MFNWNIKQSPILGLLGLSGVGSRILSFAGGVFTASGGTIVDSGGYRNHIYTSPGSFVVSGDGFVEYFLVAGGGGGGRATPGGTNVAGAGGAGGLRTGINLPISTNTYPITVGAGGAENVNGNDSIFSTITSTGGGRGHGVSGPALSGGSGGGAGATGTTSPSPGGSGNTPPTSPPQGNPGGSSHTTAAPQQSGGGGGGAGGAGGNASQPLAGSGGVGSPITWIPASYGTPGPAPGRYFAGGGGGSSWAGGGTAGAGGAGGGGAGTTSNTPTPSGPGTINTGGGGGGAENSTAGRAGSGGSGIVVIRYTYP